MKREGDPQDWRLVILLIRALKGWDYQQDMAQACRIDVGSISDYERGLKVPSPATRKKIAAGLGTKVAFLDRLVPLCRGIRLAFERALHTGSAEAVDAGNARKVSQCNGQKVSHPRPGWLMSEV